MTSPLLPSRPSSNPSLRQRNFPPNPWIRFLGSVNPFSSPPPLWNLSHWTQEMWWKRKGKVWAVQVAEPTPCPCTPMKWCLKITIPPNGKITTPFTKGSCRLWLVSFFRILERRLQSERNSKPSVKLDHRYTKPTMADLAERIASKAPEMTIDGYIQVETKRQEELAKLRKKFRREREKSR